MKRLFYVGLIFFIFLNKGFAQRKFQYISINNMYSYNECIGYNIDTTGLELNLKDPIKNYITGQINGKHIFKTSNQLFNFLGKLGWELYQTDYIPTHLQFIPNGYQVPLNSNYYFMVDHKSTTYYFKIEIE